MTNLETQTALTLYDRLAKSQSEMYNPKKSETAKAGAYSYTYATLKEVCEIVRTACNKHGVFITQKVDKGEDGGKVIITIAACGNDILELGRYSLRQYTTEQQEGSGQTYARRYSLLAAFGLAGEDDDGAAASQAPPAPKAEKYDPLIFTEEAKRAAKEYGVGSKDIAKAVQEATGKALKSICDRKSEQPFIDAILSLWPPLEATTDNPPETPTEAATEALSVPDEHTCPKCGGKAIHTVGEDWCETNLCYVSACPGKDTEQVVEEF